MFVACALSFAAGAGLMLWLCDREVKHHQEQAKREHVSAQIAREALRQIMERTPCEPPPNC